MPRWMWIFACTVTLYALHRALLWMERRGWIYYWHRRASSGSISAAALNVQSIFEPDKQHMLEIKQKKRVERDDAGDDPDAGQ